MVVDHRLGVCRAGRLNLLVGRARAGAFPPLGSNPDTSAGRGSSAEVLALQDPTLFALPHRQGFSGPAWLKVSPIANRPSDWSEEPRPLPLCVTQLGVVAPEQVQTNGFAPPRLLPMVETWMGAPGAAPPAAFS